MTEWEFINTFRVYKTSFLKDNMFKRSNANVLNLFENWLKEKTQEKQVTETNKKIDSQVLNKYLTQIISIAEDVLAQKGIKISCISLGKSIDMKNNYRCIRVFKESNIYYRIGRTLPRKGKYRNQNLLAIELIMDGNKKKVFSPMLKQKEFIEKELALSIEREMAQLEATGRYRFKIFYNIDELNSGKLDIYEIGKNLADFILVTMGYLQELKVV